MTFFSLEGKVAVITGGGSGIGLATAKRLHAAGAQIVIGDLQDAHQDAELLGGIYLKTDVAKEEDVAALLDTAVSEFGKLDILVNNAGVFSEYKSIEETTQSDLEFCFSVNTLGVSFGIKHAARLMAQGGAIVNTASYAGLSGMPTLSSYVASKFAVVGLTKTAALELAPKRIRVNCICPTTVNTPMAQEDGGEDAMAWEKVWIPLERICQPEEAAALIHFLVADDCQFLNGQAISLCGGASAGLNERVFEKLAL